MCCADPQPPSRTPAPSACGRSAPQPSVDPRRALGRRGEHLAAAHLERLGFAILARNVRTRHGEIDLIVCDSETLAFVEVKTRRSQHPRSLRSAEQPLAWLSTRQRARLRRLAAAWLQADCRERPAARAIRFDAIGVTVDHADRLLRLDHIAGAW